MPKAMFDCGGSNLDDLSKIIDLFNAAMVDVKNVKTVEELQTVINNLSRVIADIKKILKAENKDNLLL